MNKKAIQTLIFLSNRSSRKLDHTNIFQTINHLPKSDHVNIKENAQRYATQQLQSTYGIVTPQPLSQQEKNAAQQVLRQITELKRNKSVRLAGFIERIARNIDYEELEEARQFLQTLNRKDIKQMRFTLDTLHKVVDQKVEAEKEFFQNHTLKSARSLIQELKKTKKIDQL